MQNQPLFDRLDIEKTMDAAKSRRAEYLGHQTAELGGAVRWGGLGAIAAACLALLAGLGIHARAGVTGGDTDQTVSRNS